MADWNPSSADSPLPPSGEELPNADTLPSPPAVREETPHASTLPSPPAVRGEMPKAGGGSARPSTPAKPRRFHRRFLALAAFIVVFDQLTKVILRETLALGDREWLAEFFAFSHIANDGGAFGFFGGQNTVLAVSAVVAIAVVAIYYFFPPMDHWLVRSGLALILGGAVGNLLDRLYQGHVTDFIDFIHFPAFNVADAAINVGVAAIVIALLFSDLLKRNPRSP